GGAGGRARRARPAGGGGGGGGGGGAKGTIVPRAADAQTRGDPPHPDPLPARGERERRCRARGRGEPNRLAHLPQPDKLPPHHPGRTHPMMDPIRRNMLATGAAAAAAATAPQVFAQVPPAQAAQGAANMSFYQRGPAPSPQPEAGSGHPRRIIPGAGLNPTIENLTPTSPFDPVAAYKDEYRPIVADLRNATSGQSTGPLEPNRPWDSYTDDHLGL